MTSESIESRSASHRTRLGGAWRGPRHAALSATLLLGLAACADERLARMPLCDSDGRDCATVSP